MIDEKQINKAMSSYATETFNHIEERFAAMCGFKEGALWAQREFINSLWHDASEEPDRKSSCIGRYKCFSDFVTFRYPIGSSSWKDYVRFSTLHKWCYLSDLLPKEGGEGCTD